MIVALQLAGSTPRLNRLRASSVQFEKNEPPNDFHVLVALAQSLKLVMFFQTIEMGKAERHRELKQME